MGTIEKIVSGGQAIEHTQDNANAETTQPVVNKCIDLFAGKVNMTAVDLVKNATQAPTEAEKEAQKTQEEAELEEKALLEKAMGAEIHINDNIPVPKVLLSLSGVPIIIAEELTALKAKPKMGKTSTAKIFCSAMLGSKMFKVQSDKSHNKLVFIDTEQSRFDVQNIAKEVKEMCGMSARMFNNRFHIFYHREKSPDESLKELKVILKKFKPTVLVIDNVADLTNDFNNLEESKVFVDDLMSIASQNHCAVMTIQHENKAQDNTHAQGHLGAMLDKRAAVLLQCVKEDGLFVVKSAGVRHIQVPDFTFKYDDEGNLVDGEATYLEMKEMQAQKKAENNAKKKQKAKEEKWTKIQKTLRDVGGVLNRNTLVERLMKVMGKGKSTIYKYLDEFIGTKLTESNGCIYLVENSQEV